MLRREIARAPVARLAGALLEVRPVQRAAQALHVQRHTRLRAGTLDDAPVAVRVGAAQAVVDVERREGESQAEPAVRGPQEREQRHGVGAAGEQQQRPLARAQRAGAGDAVGDAALEPEADCWQDRHGALLAGAGDGTLGTPGA